MNRGLGPADFVGALTEPLRLIAERDRLWRVNHVMPGAELMAQGGAAASVFVLLSGLVKLTYATPEGGERIKSLIVDCGLFGPDLDGAEVRYAAVAIEPSLVVALPIPWLRSQLAVQADLREASARFDAWLRRRKEARELSLLCDSAEDRYREFLRSAPDLAKRLPQGDIARYIGVTPIAFSRIKRRMERKKKGGDRRQHLPGG